MINLSKFNSKKIGIFGLGVTGHSAIRSLLYTTALIFAWDDSKDNILSTKKLFNNSQVTIFFYLLLKDVKKLDFLIVSPGILNSNRVKHKIFFMCKKLKIPVFTDIDILFQICPNANFIGVTGTNGKSTTVSLIHLILKNNNRESCLGGNIGTPVLNLQHFDNYNQNYIIELSSYQLGIMKCYKFNIAALLSVTPDHLDRYSSFEDYKNAKIKIFKNQINHDYGIISLNTTVNKIIYQSLKKDLRIIPTSNKEILNDGVTVLNNQIYDNYFDNKIFCINLPSGLLGLHNSENIAIAYTVAKLLNICSEEIIKSLTLFNGLKHRMELFLQKGEIYFVNDSKATNIAATKEALNTYDNIHWIVGGIFKEQNTDALNNQLHKVQHCYLIGRDYKKFLGLVKANQASYSISNTIADSLIEIKNKIEYGTVLLSPCCASFDQWKNFEDRGDAFKRLTLRLFK